MSFYVTFYSYKGGVGRTLALINTAFTLASTGKRVIIWDLDLEAPSIFSFPQFSDYRAKVTGGTIDLLTVADENLGSDLKKYLVRVAPNIQILPAGTVDEKYPRQYGDTMRELAEAGDSALSYRVELIRQAIDALQGPGGTADPAIVLIDSRTGLTDVGAICTVQLPDVVALVYTLGHQGAAPARQALTQILAAGSKLRPDKPINTILVASFVPEEEDSKLLAERLLQLKELGLEPDFRIPFRRSLLLREEAFASSRADEPTAREFARLADRLLAQIALTKPQSLDFSSSDERDARRRRDASGPGSRAERGRTFEDKVATVLGLMDFEVEQNVIASGRQTDMIVHNRTGFQPVDYIVECKDQAKPSGVQDLDSLNARVLAWRNRNSNPNAQGLLVTANGFTAEARGNAADLKTIVLRTYSELLDQLVNLGPYNGTLIHDVAGQPIERLYVDQNLYPEDAVEGANPDGLPIFDYVDRWLADKDSPFLALLGDYGTGKTWFTRMLAYRLAQQHQADPTSARQPIRMDLKRVAKAIGLENIVFSHFQESTGRAINPKAFLHLLEEGRYVLIFDGFDEMATQGDWGVTQENFRQLMRACEGKAKVLLTCRTHYFREHTYVQELIAGRRPDLSERGTELYREISGRRGYRLAYLPGFTENQAHQYIEKACGENAPSVLAILENEPRLKEIATRPVLLEIIIKSAPRLVQLGTEISVANLYEAYTEDWFTREDWKFRITRENRRALVEALAWNLWRQPEGRLHHSALSQVLEPLLGDKAPTRSDLEQADREIRLAGFLTRDDGGNYGFSHRSFLEFFLASWISRRLDSDPENAFRHPVLTPPVLQFLGELQGKSAANAAVAVLTQAYCPEASENALLMYSRSGITCWGAQLRKARLSGFRLPGISLPNADLSFADLSSSDLSGADLSSADLTETNLRLANLSGIKAARANFTGARLASADLSSANVQGTDFVAAELIFTTLIEAVTAGASFHEADAFGISHPQPLGNDATPVGVASDFFAEHIAWHPTRPLVALAGEGGIFVVDTNTGALRRHLPHRNASAVEWDPAGSRLASASDDKTVRIWDPASGQTLRTLKGHSDCVNSVAWDPTGARLASASDDRTVRIWDTASGQALRTLKGHSDCVGSVAWDLAGARLASASDDNTVRTWDPASGQPLRTLAGHSRSVSSVAWDPAGARLASASADKTVRIWDPASGQALRTLKGHSRPVWSVAWDPAGARLASASGDKTVRLWDAASGHLLSTLAGHSDSVVSVAWDPAGAGLASASADYTVRLWDPASGQPLRTPEGHSSFVWSVAWDPAGERLASASDDNSVRLWDPASGQPLRTLKGHSDYVNSVAWDPTGACLASASDDKTVRIWDPASGHLLSTLAGHSDSVVSVAWDPAGVRLASASDDKTVRVWDPASGQPLRTLAGHSRSVSSVAWDPAGARLASASADKTVRIWDAASGQSFRTLAGHSDCVNSVAWDPAGARLASASDDQTVRLWDSGSGRSLRTLEGHSNFVMSVAWDPVGARLASASYDTTVRLWDAASGQSLRTLEGHSNWVMSVAWDPAGARLASASYDNTVRLWDAASGECLWIYYLLPEGGWLAYRCRDGKYHADATGKRLFMFTDPATPWSLYPARCFPHLEIQD